MIWYATQIFQLVKWSIQSTGPPQSTCPPLIVGSFWFWFFYICLGSFWLFLFSILLGYSWIFFFFFFLSWKCILHTHVLSAADTKTEVWRKVQRKKKHTYDHTPLLSDPIIFFVFLLQMFKSFQCSNPPICSLDQVLH